MAYTATVTLDLPKAERVGRRLGMITGTVDVTVYNSTLAELTDITKHFLSTASVAMTVQCDGPTDNGYFLSWDTTEKAFKAWKADYSTSVDGPMIEVSDDTDVGAVKFIAFGLGAW